MNTNLNNTIPAARSISSEGWAAIAGALGSAVLLVKKFLSPKPARPELVTRADFLATAADIQTRATIGQSGPLTGLQLFTKVNCALLAIGAATVIVPPAKPLLAPLPIDALEITNTAGTIAMRLHTTGAPPEGTMLRGSAPQNGGCRRGGDYLLPGTLDSPQAGYITITTPYTTRFGVPAVGTRVFVSVNANGDGYEGIPQVFSARVPASA